MSSYLLLESSDRALLEDSDELLLEDHVASITQAIGQASETDSSAALTPIDPIWVAAGQAIETDAAQALTSRKTLAIGQATTWLYPDDELYPEDWLYPGERSASARSITPLKTLATGQASETDSAPTHTSAKRLASGQAQETDTGQTPTVVKRITLGQAEETDAARELTAFLFNDPIVAEIGQATETDTADAFTPIDPLLTAIGQAEESDQAGVDRRQLLDDFNRADGPAGANWAGDVSTISGNRLVPASGFGYWHQPFSGPTLFTFTVHGLDVDAGDSLYCGLQGATSGVEFEFSPFWQGTGEPAGTETAWHLYDLPDYLDYGMGVQDVAVPEGSQVAVGLNGTEAKSWIRRPGEAWELIDSYTLDAAPDEVSIYFAAGGTVAVDDLYVSSALTPPPDTISLKTLAIGQAVDTQTAGGITPLRTYAVAQASETDSAQGVLVLRSLTIGQAQEGATAQALSVLRSYGLGQALETDEPQGLLPPGRYPVEQALETDLAQAIRAVRVLPAQGQAGRPRAGHGGYTEGGSAGYSRRGSAGRASGGSGGNTSRSSGGRPDERKVTV